MLSEFVPAGLHPGRRLHPAGEALLASVLATLAYFALQGELPYHDARRFADQVGGGVFIWDIAHILLQPAAMLLYAWSGASPNAALKALSGLSTAAAVGLFYYLLLRLNVPRSRAVLGTLILAGCCSVLTLAPSAHPKLVAFPFVNGALLCLCLAERAGASNWRPLLLGGVLLAVAGAFLASALMTAPFAALAILFAARRGGASLGTAFGRASIVGAACGLSFLLIACLGYVLLTGEPLSLAGLTGSVAGKAELRPPSLSLPVQLARVVFGTVNNLVALPELGATMQAWMRGQIPSLRPYAGLLPVLGLALVAGLLVAATYLRSAILAPRRSCLVPLAFLCGAQVWTLWYGLNDPEHWFQLTAPTITLFVTLMPAEVVRWGLPVWAATATAANLALLAVPVATYPLARHEAELSGMLRPADLLVSFAGYPGRAYVGFFNMPDVRRFRIDLQLQGPGATVQGTLDAMQGDVEQTLGNGGRVLVADVLSPTDWEAPWMSLLGHGLTKPKLQGALLAGHTAQPLNDIGGIKLWELRHASVAEADTLPK
ncbi:MAG TPA: hypothetical protein VGC15_14735 [Acetobacteraceae bacterium]